MLGDGTIPTIENEEDIYISLTALCEYFTRAALTVKQETENTDPKLRKYTQGLSDMMFTVAQEMLELGKFEAQKRMIEAVDFPEDIMRYIDRKEKK